MGDGFVSFATLLRDPPGTCVEAPQPAESDIGGSVADEGLQRDLAAEVVHELALVRLAAREAFERASARMLEALAHEILARELALAPADIAAHAAAALAHFATSDPIGLVVAPADAQRLRHALPVRIDPTLAPGDLIVEVRDGTFESRFAFRSRCALEDALARPRPAA